MRRPCPIPCFRFLALFLTLWTFAATAGAADDTARFTRNLTPAERTEAGVDKLSSDEAAVLDALVRRDGANRVSTFSAPQTGSAGQKTEEKNTTDSTATKLVESAPRPPFSQRLTADERRIAGFGKLSTAQTARLDALIERHATATLARALLAPPSFVQRGSRVQPVENADERKNIHGSYSLSFGWGKGGYSERSGSMMMTYDDPAGRYSVTIGYSETHVKGGPGPYYWEGPPYRTDGPYREP